LLLDSNRSHAATASEQACRKAGNPIVMTS